MGNRQSLGSRFTGSNPYEQEREVVGCHRPVTSSVTARGAELRPVGARNCEERGESGWWIRLQPWVLRLLLGARAAGVLREALLI